MAKDQKKYTPEFRQKIVAIYNAGGTSYLQLEKEYGISRSTLSGWIRRLSYIRLPDGKNITQKEYRELQKENQRLKAENEILEKSERRLHKRTVNEIVAFIQDNQKQYTVTQLCRVLKFPRSTYYKVLHRTPSNRQKAYEIFSEQVRQAYDESKGRYGAVKICRILNQKGIFCNVKRVQRHMARQGLYSIVIRKYNPHEEHTDTPNDKKNILNREFSADTINQKWCTDITYIHVQKEGWTYLASVMDLCSRKIIGYAYGTSMTSELAVKAVENACQNVKDTAGIILHTDLGRQYTSRVFEAFINSKGMWHSFSRKGSPYDNACMESFHSILMKEEIHLHIYQDFKEAEKAISEYIELWYNSKRIHSAVGYMTPQQREDLERRRES